MGPLNQDLPSLAEDQTFANNWVQTYIVPYKYSIKFCYLARANEVIPGDESSYVFPAMKRVKKALRSYNISIRVTTSVASQVLGQSFPPSISTFSEESKSVMTQIAQYLKAKDPHYLVVASETGWPSAGDRFAIVDLAKTYNNNLVKHVKSQKMATPLKPEERFEAYIFALFNENLKPAGVEQHCGLFYPNMAPVYPIKF
ncbi:Glycoside hydrolase family 17 [Dillenia turbinata]|uniref:Glycoside hydrolase family 17 n=1 Tax=Dillenia turbinata TaxID=194707 RepID=A0AAN8V3J8_9MAGN